MPDVIRELMNLGLSPAAAKLINDSVASAETLPAAGAGAEQTVSLLGPFPIAFNTPNIYGGSPAVGLVELVPGTVVVRLFAQISVAFDGGNDLLIGNIGAANFDDLDGFAQIVAEQANGSAQVAFAPLANVVATPSLDRIGLATVARPWLVVYIAADAPPVAGAADVYALIATPAA